MQSWTSFLSTYEIVINKDLPTHGIMDLSHLGLLKISGAKAKDLLQGQLTCDLNEITATQTRLGAHCNPQGRIISLFRIFNLQNDYYLQMPHNMISIALNALKKYAVFFKVELTDASDEWLKIGCLGSSLNEIIPNLPEIEDEILQVSDLFIIKLSGDRFQIIGKYDDITTLWVNLSRKTQILSHQSWDLVNIYQGLATIYPETSEKFLPHDINLQLLRGISFNKGCYTGQEIVARMQYKGKLKNKLLLATCESDAPMRGTDIFNEHGRAGMIIDYAMITPQKIALLVLTHDQNSQLFLDQTCTQQIYLNR